MSSRIPILPITEVQSTEYFQALTTDISHTSEIINDTILVTFSDFIVSPAPGSFLSTNKPFFTPYVNGNFADVRQSYVSSINTSQVIIQLYGSVYPQDQVNLSLTNTNSFTFVNGETSSFWIAENVTNNTILKNRHYVEIFNIINDDIQNFPNSPFYEYDPSSNNISNSLIVARTPPTGNVVINESINTNGMQVLTFASFGQQTISVGSDFANTNQLSSNYNAINFHSYAEQGISTVFFELGLSQSIINNTEGLVVKVYPDVLGQPGRTLLGVSSFIPYSSLPIGAPKVTNFSFTGLKIGKGDFWFVLSPNDGMNLPVGGNLNTFSGTDNSSLYFSEFLQSTNLNSWSVQNNLIYFSLSGSSGVALPVFAVTEDALGDEINEATNFGGSLNPSVSETIGDGAARSIRLDLLTSDNVYFVEVGSIANGVTEYIVEYRVGAAVTYQPLFSLISSQQTRDFYSFEFTSPFSISSIRLRSLGDFYYQNNNSVLTLAAQETLTNVTGVQISSFSDFRDISNLSTFDSYPGGIALKSWLLTASSSLYQKFGNRTITAPRYVGSFVSNNAIQFLVADKNKFYTFPVTSNLDNAIIAYDLSDPFETITSFLNYNQVFYFGTAKGYLYKTTDGSSFVKMNVISLIGPITSLVAFQNKIFAGITNFNNSSNVKIYQFTENSPGQFTYQVANFSSSIAENSVLEMVSGVGEIYISCGDYTNSSTGTIYKYDGSVLTQSLVYFSPIEALYYSLFSETIYATTLDGQLLSAIYDSQNILGPWNKILDIGSNINQIMEGTNANYLILTSNDNMYFYDKTNQVIITADSLPFETISSYDSLKNTWYNYNSSYSGLQSGYYFEEYSNVNYTQIPSGITNTYMVFQSEGYLVFPSSGDQTLFLNYNGVNAVVYIDDNLQLLSTDNTFIVSFVANVPKKIKIIYNTYNSVVNLTIELMYYVASVATLIPNSYLLPPIYATSVSNPLMSQDVIATANRSLFEFDFSEAITYQKFVYVRYQDSLGNATSINTPLSDYIYKNIQRSIFDDATPSGSLLEINSNKAVVSTFIPPEGSYQQLYAPDRLVRLKAVYESEPFYAPDITSWNQINILAYIPMGTIVSDSDYGTQVTVFAKEADDAISLTAANYSFSAVKSTINTQTDFGLVTSILLDVKSFTQKWIQFKVELITATAGLTPVVRAATLTYFASGQSKFFTKLFDTSLHSTVSPSPTIRRGLLTSNFALNGGSIQFGYITSTDTSQEFDFSLYTLINPNTVFELPTPSSTIRFATLITAGSTIATVIDEFAIQLDTGPDDLYFMPPEASFAYSIGIDSTVQFTSKAAGQISNHIWGFGTSSVVGIPADSLDDPLVNRVNPLVNYLVNPVGVSVTYKVQGFTQNGITFESEIFSKTLS